MTGLEKIKVLLDPFGVIEASENNSELLKSILAITEDIDYESIDDIGEGEVWFEEGDSYRRIEPDDVEFAWDDLWYGIKRSIENDSCYWQGRLFICELGLGPTGSTCHQSGRLYICEPD